MGSLGPTPATLSRSHKPRALVVFDYDFSLVNDDSDFLFCKALCPELLHRLDTPPHTAPAHGWPAIMDVVIGEFIEKHPRATCEDVTKALAAIPVFAETLDAVRLASKQFDATVAIVSDANTVFIESMLEHHKLRDCIAEIHTNTGRWEGNRLRVQPYYSLDQEPHGCALCPTNMCEGRILDALRATHKCDVVLYVGDGIGDFCPSTRLTSRDTVFARADAADGKSFGLLHRIKSSRDQVHARVVQWHSGRDIYTHFYETLQPLSKNTT